MKDDKGLAVVSIILVAAAFGFLTLAAIFHSAIFAIMAGLCVYQLAQVNTPAQPKESGRE